MDGERLKDLLPGVPLFESPFFEEVLPSCGFDLETARIAHDLNRDGIAIFHFPDDRFDERAERIKTRLASRFDFGGWRAGGWKNDGMRAPDAWRFDEDVRALASNAKVLDLLAKIYGRQAWPFQTLNFPVGSQQHFHSDSVHFSSIPERFMCGVWVALEDVKPEAGPLEYYPGSHKWPIIYNDKIGVRAGSLPKGKLSQALYHDIWQALIDKAQIQPRYFAPKKGEAVIWAANLLHGGSRQLDPNVTRWSQVTHYFFENCCYVTPMQSDMAIGKLALRSLTNIVTGDVTPNIYIDSPLYKLGHKVSLIKASAHNRLKQLIKSTAMG